MRAMQGVGTREHQHVNNGADERDTKRGAGMRTPLYSNFYLSIC